MKTMNRLVVTFTVAVLAMLALSLPVSRVQDG